MKGLPFVGKILVLPTRERIFCLKKVIHIYGASGSGTTTLGKKISDETGYFFMDTDDYYWLPVEPKYSQKRAIEDRLILMKRDIENNDNVVISGSLVGWGDELIPYFSLAIRLITDSSVRIERLRKREKAEFGDSILPGGERYEEFTAFIEWASQYDTGDLNIRSKVYHDEWEKLLKCKKIVLNGADDLNYNFQKVMTEIE